MNSAPRPARRTWTRGPGGAQRDTEQAGRSQAREQHASWSQQHGADYPLAAQFAELATRLFAAGSVIGVLAHLVAAHAGVALASVSALAAASAETAQLREAMESRDVIGQAKGILMERRKLTPEQAFDLLWEASSRLNTKLIELARLLAETGQDLPRPPLRLPG